MKAQLAASVAIPKAVWGSWFSVKPMKQILPLVKTVCGALPQNFSICWLAMACTLNSVLHFRLTPTWDKLYDAIREHGQEDHQAVPGLGLYEFGLLTWVGKRLDRGCGTTLDLGPQGFNISWTTRLTKQDIDRENHQLRESWRRQLFAKFLASARRDAAAVQGASYSEQRFACVRKVFCEQDAHGKGVQHWMRQRLQPALNVRIAEKEVRVDARYISSGCGADCSFCFDQIEKAREAQVLKERQDKIRQRKAESKRVDHLARALREEETPMLKQWTQDVESQDAEQLEKFESANAEEQRKQHQLALKEKDDLLPFQRVRDSWADEKLEPRRADFEDMLEAQIHRLEKKVVANKIARARARYEQQKKDEDARAERAQRERLAEERRHQAEREAREQAERQERLQREREEKRAAEEARRREDDERRARAEEMRREREREIEEREARERQEAREARDKRQAERTDRADRADRGENSWRRDGRDDGDSWRRNERNEQREQPSRDDWRKRGETGDDGTRRQPAREENENVLGSSHLYRS
eukprot:s1047_g8.t1